MTRSLLSKALIDKSLLPRADVGGIVRYTLHELVRQYAAEHLAADSHEQTPPEVRHTAYYAECVTAYSLLHTADSSRIR